MPKKRKQEHICECGCGIGGNFWGWLLVLVGGLLLVKSMGWIPDGAPVWAVVLIVFGVWLLVGKKKYRW